MADQHMKSTDIVLHPRLATPDIHLHRAMLSKHRRGPWSSAEDQYLLELVRTQGASNWVRISQLIGSRSPKQCRERFHQNLKPTLNLEPISPEEGILIERMVAEMGKRWAEIARRLHGRSDNAVKNWWNGGMNRRKRLDNRRAELAPRQSQPSYHQQQHHQHQQASYNSYASRADQHYTHAHSYATAAAPQQQAHRYNTGIEAPLPSPSAFSTISRSDSADGCAPPSLVSSELSYASYSHPTTPQQASELPPLALLDSRYQQSSSTTRQPSYPIHTATPSYPTKHHQSQDYAAAGFPLLAEQWRVEQSPTSVSPLTRGQALPYSGPQMQLPSFHTISAPSARGGVEPSSPAKDKRMDLSKLLA